MTGKHVVGNLRGGRGAGGGAARQRIVCRQYQRRASARRHGVTTAEFLFEIAEDEIAPARRRCAGAAATTGEAHAAASALGVISPPAAFQAGGHRVNA